MAPKKATKPGKTSRYYQSAKGRKSYEKQKKKQKKINSTPAKKEYRKKLARKRRELGIMGKGGKTYHIKVIVSNLKYPRKTVPVVVQNANNPFT